MLAAHMNIKKSPQPKAIFYFIYFLFYMFPISHASYFTCFLFCMPRIFYISDILYPPDISTINNSTAMVSDI